MVAHSMARTVIFTTLVLALIGLHPAPAPAPDFSLLLGSGGNSEEQTCNDGMIVESDLILQNNVTPIYVIIVILQYNPRLTLSNFRGDYTYEVTPLGQGRTRLRGHSPVTPVTNGSLVTFDVRSSGGATDDTSITVSPSSGENALEDSNMNPVQVDFPPPYVVDCGCFPIPGEVFPPGGASLCGRVTFATSGWSDDSCGPLRYQWSYSDGGAYSPLTDFSSDSNAAVDLPSFSGPITIRLGVKSSGGSVIEHDTVYSSNCASPDYSGGTDSSGDFTLIAPVTTTGENRLFVNDDATSRGVEIIIPGGALTSATTAEVKFGDLSDERAAAGDTSSGIVLSDVCSIELTSGQTALNEPVCVQFEFEDADQDGVPDFLSGPLNDYCLASFNEGTGEWQCEDDALQATQKPGNGTTLVCGETTHFSMFALIETPAARVRNWSEMD